MLPLQARHSHTRWESCLYDSRPAPPARRPTSQVNNLNDVGHRGTRRVQFFSLGEAYRRRTGRRRVSHAEMCASHRFHRRRRAG